MTREEEARAEKARKMAELLRQFKFTREMVEQFEPDHWAMLAQAARCQPPHSQATIDAVLSLLPAKGRRKQCRNGWIVTDRR